MTVLTNKYPELDSSRIKDIPSIRGLLDQIEQADQLRKVWPLLKSLLGLSRADVDDLSEQLQQLRFLREQVEELAELPDRFNNFLGQYGWIAYGSMNIHVMREALELAESGDVQAAEVRLVQHYNPEQVEMELGWMNKVRAFQPRMRLARLALNDYEEGRYHACIPIVLALLDGMVNDISNNLRGFFADGADLTAWDSIAGHSKGLARLSELFKKPRKKICTDPITIPYRNGIMHGIDLAYDNKVVAAKVWAALFAAGEWAAKMERGETYPEKSRENPNLREILDQLREVSRERQLLAEWRPRQIVVGKKIPVQGMPEDYSPGSPEQRLVEYLSCWINRNYGYMARHVSVKMGVSEKKLAGEIRHTFHSINLTSYRLKAVQDRAPAVTEVATELEFDLNGKTVKVDHAFRLIYQTEEGKPLVRTMPGGSWRLITWEVQLPLQSGPFFNQDL